MTAFIGISTLIQYSFNIEISTMTKMTILMKNLCWIYATLLSGSTSFSHTGWKTALPCMLIILTIHTSLFNFFLEILRFYPCNLTLKFFNGGPNTASYKEERWRPVITKMTRPRLITRGNGIFRTQTNVDIMAVINAHSHQPTAHQLSEPEIGGLNPPPSAPWKK